MDLAAERRRARARCTSGRLRRRPYAASSEAIAASRVRTSASSASSRIPAACEPLRVDARARAVVRAEARRRRTRRNAHTAGSSRAADASRPERHAQLQRVGGAGGGSSRSGAAREHPARVVDVVDLHGELPDAVGGGERGRAALHAQPLRVVRDGFAASCRGSCSRRRGAARSSPRRVTTAATHRCSESRSISACTSNQRPS